MSLEKSITHRKEHRKPYRGAKRGKKMTENNVIKFFREQADFVKNNHSFYPPNEIYEILFEMINELHQYREIGTVEECRIAIENKFTKPHQ